MIRAVFLDIDGTLISMRTHAPGPRTAEALLAAKEKGIRLFIATGRNVAVPEEGYVMDDLPDCFDGYVCLTGQYCFTQDGTPVLKAPLAKEDLVAIQTLADTYGIPYTFDYENSIFISMVNDRVRRHNESIDLPIPKVARMDVEREVFALTLYIDKEQEETLLMPRLRHSMSISWTKGITNICSKEGGGKRAGILAMLRHFGIRPEETMGIGDSDNDLSMFECVGTAVAMGNSSERILAAADYVTTDCEEDGIYHAFRHYGLI